MHHLPQEDWKGGAEAPSFRHEFNSLRKVVGIRSALYRPALRTPILGWGPGEKIEINSRPRPAHYGVRLAICCLTACVTVALEANSFPTRS